MKYLNVLLLFAVQAFASHAPNKAPHNAQLKARSPLVGRGSFDGSPLFRRQGCNSGEVPCGSDYCMPAGDVCCPDGGYCRPGKICWPFDTTFQCCSPGDVECGKGCMPPGSACCSADAHYCDPGETCFVDSGSTYCCKSGQTCTVSIPFGCVCF